MDYQQEPERRLTEEERREKINRIKRKRKIRRIIVSVGFLLLIAIISTPIIIFGVFKIKTIRIKGMLPYENQEIYDACPIKTGDNLIFSDYEKAVKILESKLPYLGNTTITRSFPSTIIINADVASEDIAIELTEDSTYLILDENLRILRKYGYVPETAVVFKTPAPATDAEGETLIFTENPDKDGNDTNAWLNPAITEIITELKEEGLCSKTDYVNLTNPGNIRISYDHRIMLKLGTATELASKIELAADTIESEDKLYPDQLRTIDLTIIKRAYVKPNVFEENEPVEEEINPDEELNDEEDTDGETSENGETDTESEPNSEAETTTDATQYAIE